MNYKLPAQEIEIGERLRGFREYLRISRTVFALEIGISSERLASYEAGRVRLPYETFAAIAERFSINPVWLAEGLDLPQASWAFDDSAYRTSIVPRSPFSFVFNEFLKKDLTNDAYNLQKRVFALHGAMKSLAEFLSKRRLAGQRMLPDMFARWRVTEIQKTMPFILKELQCDTPMLSDDEIKRWGLPKSEAEGGMRPGVQSREKKNLTPYYASCNNDAMKSPMRSLLGRVVLATKARGKKAALAKLLKVPPPRVSEWLHGAGEPSGEITLRLLKWVEAEEAQQKSPGDVTTVAKGKTRSEKERHANFKTSPRKR